MLNLNTKLKEIDEQGKKIKAGIVGAGQMGRGMVSQMFCMKGILPAIISDIDIERAKNAYLLAGISSDDIAVANKAAEAEAAIQKGKYVITEDFNVITSTLPIDVNVETDVTVGPLLKKMADSAGVVYTVSAGDEPGAVKELYDFADAMGFKILVAGKGKNNPLDIEANPDTVREKAQASNMNPKMLASFVDGTKTMVEMTCVSNATGFVPTKRGMIGPESTIKELPKLLSLKEQGGILDRYKVVEFVKGIAPGVFVIITTDLPAVKEEMAYLSMGEGPNYILYRPYHLTSIETPLSAARACIYHEPTIVPKGAPVSETVAVAKKDLKAGEYLDSIGGYTVYGVIDTFENAKKDNALPIGLVSPKVKVKTDIKKGETLTYDAVELDENSFILQLRKLQDMTF